MRSLLVLGAPYLLRLAPETTMSRFAGRRLHGSYGWDTIWVEDLRRAFGGQLNPSLADWMEDVGARNEDPRSPPSPKPPLLASLSRALPQRAPFNIDLPCDENPLNPRPLL